ncbi:MAG: flavin reductase [Dehalococcoidales bacterium]|nr:MAG: flavin reductase [Dehalococcoidales bacterium]
MDPKALHKIGYGLYVVTSRKGEKLNGQIANTVFQITSEPPTVAVSINKSNLTWEYINESGVFAVSVLCQDTPLDFIGRFGFKSGRDIDKLEGINHKTGQTKAPIVIDNAVSYLEAEVVNKMDMGTHTVFAGRVVDAEVLTDDVCMTYDYYHQIKRGTTPKTAPSYVAEEKRVEAPGLEKYRCTVCGWVYDPELGDPNGGIAPGTPFDKVPDDWVCPVCGAAKSAFEKI